MAAADLLPASRESRPRAQGRPARAAQDEAAAPIVKRLDIKFASQQLSPGSGHASGATEMRQDWRIRPGEGLGIPDRPPQRLGLGLGEPVRCSERTQQFFKTLEPVGNRCLESFQPEDRAAFVSADTGRQMRRAGDFRRRSHRLAQGLNRHSRHQAPRGQTKPRFPVSD